MAIIYSYPSGGTALGADQLLITRIVNLEPRNYNLTIDAISAYTINSLTSGGTANTLSMFSTSGLIDSPISSTITGSGTNVIKASNIDRFIIDKPSGVTSGDPEYLISQDDVWKASFGWDDDGAGFGYLYNWAGNGWRFGAAGNNPELTIVTTAGQEGVTIENELAVQGEAKFNANVIVDDKIGIRIANPQRELDVDGGVRIRHTLDLFQGNNNSFAGQDAGNLFNIVAGSNTGFGKNSQAVNISGSSNTSMGLASLGALVTGNNNTAIGTNSMQLSNGGSFNTALGGNSLLVATAGNSNTAIGFAALLNKTTSNFNTAVGNGSLANITTGFRNTAVGNGAGKFTSDGTTANATGNNSVFIGDSAKAQANGQDNQIVIGEGAIGNGTNTATIGNTTTSALHVGGNNTGIVLKAPNGTAYKITVSNAGALVVS